jgi:hypothetical protein
MRGRTKSITQGVAQKVKNFYESIYEVLGKKALLIDRRGIMPNLQEEPRAI